MSTNPMGAEGWGLAGLGHFTPTIALGGVKEGSGVNFVR